MRVFSVALALLVASVLGGGAQTPPASQNAATSPPFEIVKQDIDLEIIASGEYWQSDQLVLRPLTELGVQALRQRSFSYTSGYQRMVVGNAYTLKKNGTRIDVPPGSILYGLGETTRLGYGDTRTISVVFPNVEIGDQVSITTTVQQVVPWFAGIFAEQFVYPGTTIARDVNVAVTAPSSGLALNFDASGFEAGPVQTLGGKTRRSWHYHSDAAVKPEPDAVTEIDREPHLGVSTLSDYAAAAGLHAGLYRDKVAVTPPITELANRLTDKISDRREQARALYDWVSLHIKYVDIVLGAGGFTPHRAEDVLHNAYGDCKDHVMLLQALLAAKGIESSPVLIRAGANQYELPKAVSPFIFDHLITYIPEFQLYLDSTAEHAPFGVLPGMDAGKSVLMVEPAKVARTPPAKNSTIQSETTLTVNSDGSADGDTKTIASGAEAVQLRAQVTALPVDEEDDYFRAVLGAGSAGKLQRSNPDELSDKFAYSAHYHIPNFTAFPGPGAFPSQMGYKPFYFSQLVGGSLPPTRARDYVCPSIDADEKVTVTYPRTLKVLDLPPPKTIAAPEVELKRDFKRLKPNTVEETVHLHVDHPEAVCGAAYYAKTRGDFSRMLTMLQAQIIYR